MKKRFNFKDVGKRLPYRVPENFFEDTTHMVMNRVAKGCEEERNQGVKDIKDLISESGDDLSNHVIAVRKSLLLRRVVSVAASAACLGIICYFVFAKSERTETHIAECKAKTVKEYSIEETFERMSDEDLLNIAAIASTEQMYDIF